MRTWTEEEILRAFGSYGMRESYSRYCKNDIDTTKKLTYHIPTPKKVIFNENYQVTVVLWEDGTKTIVRCAENTTPDPYAAYCAAFAKKCYGSNSKLKKTIKKLTVLQDTKMKNQSCPNESLPPDPLNFKY